MNTVPDLTRVTALFLVAVIGALLFLPGLGNTGLIDETPSLFAASARAMAETGDWLIPHANGLPRYDKPPLVYWLMGLFYALPGQKLIDPLGTWAAGLPSALATIGVMLGLAETLLRWPQRQEPSSARNSKGLFITPIVAALAFALSPLVLLWGRISVSDGLFTALVAASLLMGWRTYAVASARWWPAWLVLGLAVLTKGPVAVILMVSTLLLFAAVQGDVARLRATLKPLRGIVLTTLVTAPWYALAFWREGSPFVLSFFGYHNLQRFSQVVNNHHQPWWFFIVMLLVASLPFTPFLLLGLAQELGRLRHHWPLGKPQPPRFTLQRFATCWLLSVLLFFSVAATKLPSYWLPAVPAAALLTALAATRRDGPGRRIAMAATVTVLLALATGLGMSAVWIPWIQDPTLPTLRHELLKAPWLQLGAALLLISAVLAALPATPTKPQRLLPLQLPLLAFVPLVLLPVWEIGDALRGAPVRRMASIVLRESRSGEPLAMVGLMKPSLHFYARRVVIYEGRSASALVNVEDRLRQEHRRGFQPTSLDQQPSVLLVIDRKTLSLPHWQGLAAMSLGASGPYQLVRMDRDQLQRRARELQAAGHRINWRDPRPERY